jgi:hypothetical protein
MGPSLISASGSPLRVLNKNTSPHQAAGCMQFFSSFQPPFAAVAAACVRRLD